MVSSTVTVVQLALYSLHLLAGNLYVPLGREISPHLIFLLEGPVVETGDFTAKDCLFHRSLTKGNAPCHKLACCWAQATIAV